VIAAMPKTEYANMLSRLLLRDGFDNQFAFPILAHGPAARLFGFIERLLPDPPATAPLSPVLLACLPRTGSTWMQKLLSAHPCLGSFTNWMHHFRSSIRVSCAVARFLHLDARGERFIRDSVVNGLHDSSEGLAFWGEWLGLDPGSLAHVDPRRADLGEAKVRELYKTVAKALAQFPGERRFFCKNPGFIPHVTLLAELFPDARFVHLVRDPRPTANSMLKLLARCDEQLAVVKASGRKMAMELERFVPYPRLPRLAEYAARFGVDDVRTTARLWRDSIRYMEERGPGLGKVLTVRFESVLADPAGAVARILDFCGLPPFDEDDPVFAELCRGTGKVAHVNAYRDYEFIADICGPAMRQMGYDPAAPPGTRAAPRDTPAPRESFGEIV
jgi:hypothetical protein